MPPLRKSARRWYVHLWGDWFSMDRDSFITMLRYGAAGQTWRADLLGHRLARPPVVAGTKTVMVSPGDWPPEEYQEALSAVESGRPIVNVYFPPPRYRKYETRYRGF